MSEPLQAVSGDMTMTLEGDSLTVQLYDKTNVYPLNQIYSVEYMPPTWMAGGQFTFVRSVGPTTMGLASGNRKKMAEVWGAFADALSDAVEKAVPKVETPAAIAKRKPVVLDEAQYLGGIDGIDAGVKGSLVFNEVQIGIALGWDKPSEALVSLDSIAFVEIDGGQVAKNRALPVVLFGVAGLAAKGTKDRTFINVTLNSGSVVVYQAGNLPPQQVVAKISGLLVEMGVPLGAPSQASSAAPYSVADEIEKLASLRDRGILTDEEFSAKKAQLLS